LFDFCEREESLSFAPRQKEGKLDFEARVPVPFSIFPSTYREAEAQTTQTHEEVDLNLPKPAAAGREGQYSSFSATAGLPPRGRFSEEEVRIQERYRRPGTYKESYSREDLR
jgi:hypothetical protein